MDILRKGFDGFYDLMKPLIFKTTAKDPEKAHGLFVSCCKILHKFRLENLILDNNANYNNNWDSEISNAAGFNKNAEIHPDVLKYLGFDRVVIGTVTNDVWDGNPRPRAKRFSETESLVNWMGLPGIGAKRVAERINDFGDCDIPLTINLMSTPGKQGYELLKDLEGTITEMDGLHFIDRYTLNISCPNTHGSGGGIDAREEYKQQLGRMLETVRGVMKEDQELYLKVSPDLDEKGVEDILEIVGPYNVQGFVVANTTTNHKSEYINNSPGKGGASGNAVYDESLRVQKLFADKMESGEGKIIACGGINSLGRLNQRLSIGNTREVQLYTPLIFSGTRLLRELRA